MIRLPECPICGKSVPPASDPSANFSPFCTRRCKEVDLMRWCEGRYAIVEPIDPSRITDSALGVSEANQDDFSDESAQDDSGYYDN